MGLGGVRVGARADAHRTPGGVVVAVRAVGCVATPRRMDRHPTLDACAEVGGHRSERSLLVGVERVAADRRDHLAVETGAVGRELLEAPVGVPVLGEQRRRLVGAAHDRRDVRMPVDRCEERIVPEGSEPERERLEIVVGQLLVGERQHLVGEPGRTNRGGRLVVEVAQVEPAHGRATRLAAGSDVHCHQSTIPARPRVPRHHRVAGWV